MGLYEVKKIIENEFESNNIFELAIGGNSKSYKDRDFLWRVTIAKNSSKNTVFENLSDFMIYNVSLDGNLLMKHYSLDNNELIEEINNKPLQIHSFSGDAKTECLCDNTFITLTTKKLDAFGSIETEDKNEGALIVLDKSEDRNFGLKVKQLIFVANGGLKIRETKQELNKYEYFISNGEILNLEATKKDSHIIICSIIMCKPQ